MNALKTRLMTAIGAATAMASTGLAAPAGTAFTYQGSLSAGGAPANGVYDLRFGIHAAAAGGGPMNVVELDNVQVTGGLFTVKLDFGVGYLTGGARWLEVGVRPGAQVGAYTTLSPRQELTPAPYAIGLALPYHGDDNSNDALMFLTQYGTGPVLHTQTHGTNSGVQSFIINNANPNFAVLGNTNGTGAGVKGISSGTGAAISGETSGAGDAISGRTTGSGDAVYGQNHGTGNAVFGYNLSSSGRAGFFRNESMANTSPALRSEANGGSAGEFAITANGNSRPAVLATTVGTGQAGAFVTSNAANNLTTLSASTNGTGKAFVATTTGSGVAATAQVNNPASAASAMHVTTNGSGKSLFVENNGTGAAIFARTLSATRPAIEVETGSIRAIGAGLNAPTFAYRHITTDANIENCIANLCYSTRLDHPMLNNNPGAILFVTEVVDPAVAYVRQATLGVQYKPETGRWYLRAQGDASTFDPDEDFDEGQVFNILIITN